MFRIEHDVETGEIKEIELTAKEIKELEKEYAEAKAKNDIAEAKAITEQAEAEAKATAKAALLNRLNITEDEAKLLLS